MKKIIIALFLVMCISVACQHSQHREKSYRDPASYSICLNGCMEDGLSKHECHKACTAGHGGYPD